MEENVDGMIEATVFLSVWKRQSVQATHFSVTICEGGASRGSTPTLIFRCSGKSFHQTLILELCSRAHAKALEDDKSQVGL
jgi:hypothetical protein